MTLLNINHLKNEYTSDFLQPSKIADTLKSNLKKKPKKHKRNQFSSVVSLEGPENGNRFQTNLDTSMFPSCKPRKVSNNQFNLAPIQIPIARKDKNMKRNLDKLTSKRYVTYIKDVVLI